MGSGGKTVGLLRGVSILADPSDTMLESLLAEATEKTFGADQTIIKDGSYLANLYITISGRVEVRKKASIIARLGKGQFFGEMVFLNDKPTGRSADIVAVEETRCLEIPGPVWYAFLRRNPDVALEAIRTLADRLRNVDWALGELQNLPVRVSSKWTWSPGRNPPSAGIPSVVFQSWRARPMLNSERR